MKKKHSGSVPISFDLCFLSKYQTIQFVIIMTPTTRNLEGDFPTIFEFPQSEYGERKVDGSYHYSDLANIPQSKVDQCLLSKVQFYHHLPARYRNCSEIINFINFVSKKEHPDSQLNDDKDKSVDLSKLPPSYPLPDGLKPIIWIQVLGTPNQALGKPNFKDFKVLMDFLEENSQSKLQLSKESVTVLGTMKSHYEELLKSVLGLKNENEEKESEIYQYLMNKSDEVKQNLMAKDEKFAKWNYSDGFKFNGSEDDIVVYVTDSYLYLPAITRSRKLLVVITYVEYWQKNREGNPMALSLMEEAVDKNLVTKLSSFKQKIISSKIKNK